MRIWSKNIDNYIVFAVLLQSLLIIMQHVMMSIFHVAEESTTFYRILLTAAPLSIAIGISLYRKWLLFFAVYIVTIIILLCNIIMFPQNAFFLWYDSFRFLLPVVIPSALCLICVSGIDVVEKVLYKISWGVVILIGYYVMSFFSGEFVITTYNMSLSYGLLLPAVSLYTRKKWYSLCAALFLFVVIVVLGSRGAAIIFMLYVCYDIFQANRRLFLPIMIFALISACTLPLFLEWLDGIGVQSRTLSLLLSDNITYTSGRDYIYDKVMEEFWNNPIVGMGLWGDRVILAGIYCHNIILELYLNWGIVIGSILFIYFVYKLVHVYMLSDKNRRNILVKYFMTMVIPLMASGSYLTSYNFGTFIGILVLIHRDNHSEG
ncbi:MULTISPECIES: O-antigen ligase family protein [Butyricimonas]|uniref:O-antigen ligase family protein n=1 Tax=Butyricimonas TaxID=574697 RepID=UPI002109BC63|nr:O-antigen ligase family protein [Butyricimonas paravirosa]MCI6412670.1 hypothetical protein [Butyricimonas virosa]MCQ4872488.1 hypothetical protein [Butyricimonas paravirosa]MDY5489760.1 hypothetical protein [Butyricimonas virosa]